MTRRVPFTTYEEFVYDTDNFVMSMISLFICDKPITTSEMITSIVDFILRFNELYAKSKLSANDKQLVMSYFTADGITDTVSEAFEYKIAPVVANCISDIIIRNLDIMLAGQCAYSRVDLRRWISDMTKTGD